MVWTSKLKIMYRFIIPLIITNESCCRCNYENTFETYGKLCSMIILTFFPIRVSTRQNLVESPIGVSTAIISNSGKVKFLLFIYLTFILSGSPELQNSNCLCSWGISIQCLYFLCNFCSKLLIISTAPVTQGIAVLF